MKRIIFALLLSLSFGVQAADICISVSAAEANRFAVVVGEEWGLTEPQTPTQILAGVAKVIRPATAAEMKQALIDLAKLLISRREGDKLRKQATDAVVVPTFDPK